MKYVPISSRTYISIPVIRSGRLKSLLVKTVAVSSWISPFCWRHLASGLRTVLLQQRGDTLSAFALLAGCSDEEWLLSDSDFQCNMFKDMGLTHLRNLPAAQTRSRSRRKSPVEHNPNCCETKPNFNLHDCLKVYLLYRQEESLLQVVYHFTIIHTPQNYAQQDIRGSQIPPQVCPHRDHQ